MEAVWQPGVRTKPPATPPTVRQRSLPLEAAVQYGLLTARTYEATQDARRLADAPPERLDDEFARHILIRLGGVRVVEAAQQMRLDSLGGDHGVKVTGDSLARYLSDQGFPVTVHNTAINTLRMWLARAGVFVDRTWEVDSLRKSKILGLDDEEMAAVVGLSEEQRAFLVALCRRNPSGYVLASEIRNLAIPIVGRPFGESSLPNLVLKPLARAGLIEYDTKGTSGGKAARLRTTGKFRAEVLQSFLEHAVQSLDAPLTAYYKKPPQEIYAEMMSSDPLTKGMALEAFAIYIMRLLGLRFVGWRKRAQDTTGRAEIDVLMAGLIGGLPTRWQIQCKNTPSRTVDLEDVAKEVGLLPLTNATHLVVLANCRFTEDARVYALEVMRHTSVSIFLLDHSDFERIRKAPGELSRILRAKGEETAYINRGGSLWNF